MPIAACSASTGRPPTGSKPRASPRSDGVRRYLDPMEGVVVWSSLTGRNGAGAARRAQAWDFDNDTRRWLASARHLAIGRLH